MQLSFTYARVTSGRELVLEIRRDAYLNTLAERARAAKGVDDVELVTDRTAGAMDRRDEIHIRFDVESAGYAELSKTDASGVDRIARTLIDDERYPLETRVLPDRRLAIGVNSRQLTLMVVEALQSRSEVEYAQANFVVLGTY